MHISEVRKHQAFKDHMMRNEGEPPDEYKSAQSAQSAESAESAQSAQEKIPQNNYGPGAP